MVHDAECQFNDGANEKDLEQSKNVWAWKAAAIKVSTKYKNLHQILLSLRKKKKQKV